MLASLISWLTRHLPRPLLQRMADGGGKLLALLLRGSRYEDNFDGRCYRRLLPYGRILKRENALAPGSLSLERHRLIWLFLQREINLRASSYAVLHMAPERCLQRALQAIPTLYYVSADLVSPWAAVHCDIQALPFPDNSFDLILCNHVLEHIPDDRRALRELYRVLKPNGLAFLLVPMDSQRATTLEDPAICTPQLREKYYYQRDHLRLYGTDYPVRLLAAGFHVQILNYAQLLPPELAQRFALRLDEPLYLATK